MTRFQSGHLLAQKVFDQMANENVFSLVEYMLLNNKHHTALNHLHCSFDRDYWKMRFAAVKKCPVWDIIAAPEHLGLVQFGQLFRRHRNIIQRTAPVIEKEVHGLPNGPDGHYEIGNRYFLYRDRLSIHLGEIHRVGNSVSLSPSIYSWAPRRLEYHALAEPFLLQFTGTKLSVQFIPTDVKQSLELTLDLSDNLGFYNHCTVSSLPRMVNGGNFRDSKIRFYPVMMRHGVHGQDELTFRLLKFEYNEINVSIHVVWTSTIPHRKGQSHKLQQFVANRKHAAFMVGTTFYLVPFENSHFKVMDTSVGLDVEIRRSRGLLHLVEDTLFLQPLQAHLTPQHLTPTWRVQGVQSLKLFKLDTVAKRWEDIWSCPIPGQTFMAVVGRNLCYGEKEIVKGMILLDGNVTLEHEESLPWKWGAYNVTASCSVNVALHRQTLTEPLQFQIFLDDENILQSEMNACFNST